MGIICGISVSLLVVVAGLFLLAKTKKEQLNNMFTFASFTVIILGILLMIASVFGGMCHVMSSKCGERGCYSKIMGGCDKGEGSCYKMQMRHGMQMCCKEQKCGKMRKWDKSGKCSGWKTCEKKDCDRKGCSKKHIDAEKEIEEAAAEE